MLEPIVHGLEGEPFAAAVLESARRLAALGPDVLKLQFPLGAADEARACRALSEACGQVPWLLLGGGADGDVFFGRLEVAMAAGARGFIAGRTIWDAALVVEEAWRIPAPPLRDPHGGTALTVGLRPEAITIEPDDRGVGEVLVSEPLGSEVIVNVKVGSVLVKVRTAADVRPGPGTRVRLAALPGEVRLFDPVSGAALA